MTDSRARSITGARALRPLRDVPFQGGFPYHVLARFGITPSSTSTEILDALYGMTPAEQRDQRINQAWESLRITRRRLLVDFLCVELPAPDVAPELTPDGPRPPLPWQFLTKLAYLVPELDAGSQADGRTASPTAEVPMPDALGGSPPLWDTGLAGQELG